MTANENTHILALNSGSSSLKFSLYRMDNMDIECLGSITRIGKENSQFEIRNSKNGILKQEAVHYRDLNGAVKEIIQWLKENGKTYTLTAIGHRLVQGGPDHREPELITDTLLKTLHEFVYLAPNHLPDEIEIIAAFQSAYPDIPQIACFDTAFHQHMPSYVKYYPLPAAYKDQGLIRYGFHGLSYEYILQELQERNPATAKQKIIIAHLGNGSSMAAIKDGLSIDTTMGLSPMGGLVMATRSGDLDPGVLLFLLKKEKLKVDELDDLLSKHSGLKAIAGISDVQELLEAEKNEEKAKEAITVFCYQAKKFIGALTAAMGGIDMLIFTGGVGENSAIIRDRICHDLAFLEIKLDEAKNLRNEEVISKAISRVSVQVIKTNEELMIARLVCHVLNYTVKK